MELGSPIFLLALAPWLALSLWLLWGRRRRIPVPFLKLWEVPEELRRPREKSLQAPPVYVLLAVLAMLAGILASAGPAIVRKQSSAGLTIVIDRGASMSALADGKPRFAELAEEAAGAIERELGPGTVRLVELPGGREHETGRSEWAARARSMQRTAGDTGETLRATAAVLAEKRTPAIILSDRIVPPALTLVQIQPSRPVSNAGIERVSASRGQVMVRIRGNVAGLRRVKVTSGEKSARAEVQLEPGSAQDVFVDLPEPGSIIEAALEAGDDFDGDDRAWLVRSRNWAVVELRGGVPDEVRRMADVYGRHRAVNEASGRVAIGRGDQVRGDESAVILAPVGTEGAAPPVQIEGVHPITRHVNWAQVEKGAAVAPEGPGEGWTVLARCGNRPILAVREVDDLRRVWIGFTSRPFSRSPDFAVFWTNVLDWAGGGGEGYHSRGVGEISPRARRVEPESLPPDVEGAMWPGVFDEQGLVATNTAPVAPRWGASDWRADLARLKGMGRVAYPLSEALALAAALLLLGAAALWEKERKRAAATSLHLEAETTKRVEPIFEADGHVHRKETAERPGGDESQ